MRSILTSALLGAALVGNVSADFDKWMGGGDCPWEGKNGDSSPSAKQMPDTGVTRTYDFSVARATLAPDGVEKSMIVVNGQYPGPLLEANWGDWFEVTVSNDICGPDDVTSMHWHGLNQPGTPFYDGVVTVDQCPLAPGTSLTYKFRADVYGTSWYHSHYSAQYSQGVHGPIVVHGPTDAQYDVDLDPILVNDWYHDPYDKIMGQVLSPPAPGAPPFRPFANSNLVGGAGQCPCANITDGTPCTVVPFASWEFEQGKTYRLRFVNTGSANMQTVSIDGHTMTVIANDFIPVQPYDTKFVTLGVAQRTDVLVTANAGSGSFWLRTSASADCGENLSREGRGIIYYSGTDPSVAPTSTGDAPPENPVCSNDALTLTVPAYAAPVAEPDTTLTLVVTGKPDDTGVFRWQINGSSYQGALDQPVLLDAMHGQTGFPTERNVYNTGTNGTVRIHLINKTPAPHPIHLHGHDFQVLAEGSGDWDGTITNPSNPQRRDVQMLMAGPSPADTTRVPSYLVLQFEQDNPGVWPLHCHVSWHLGAGLTVLLQERPDELAQIPVPSAVLDTCNAYKQWVTSNPAAGVEDALKKRSTGRYPRRWPKPVPNRKRTLSNSRVMRKRT